MTEAEYYYQQCGLPPLAIMAPHAIVPGTACKVSIWFSIVTTLSDEGSSDLGWDFSWAQHTTLRLALNEVKRRLLIDLRN